MGVNVDGLTYPLHRPTVYGRQTRGQSFLSNYVMSHHATIGSGTFLGGVKPPGFDI
jgi:hypothetical protein